MDMDTDDVAALERNSYRTMDDGLWDLLLGAFLLSFPLGDRFDVPVPMFVLDASAGDIPSSRVLH